MSEERFEAWLRENADSYHRPPDSVPRDEMWEQVVRARAGRRPLAPHSSLVAPRSFRYALAASLLIGAGIGLGYWMRGTEAVPASVVVAPLSGADSTVRNATFEAAATQHLSAVEAMLTSYRSTAAPDTDQAMRRWARDLLSSTRLLLDSPAADDAARRTLLEDLESVLMQIVQLDPNAPAEDRAMVDRAINREQVLTRIRSSIPAGFPSGN